MGTEAGSWEKHIITPDEKTAYFSIGAALLAMKTKIV